MKIPTITHKGVPVAGMAYGNAVMVGFEMFFILSSVAKIDTPFTIPN
jgi:hypothetical protein